MTRRSDAVLTGGLLLATRGLAWILEVAFHGVAVGAGALAAFLAEALAYRYETRVRSLWADARVRAASTVLAVGAILVGAVLVPVAAFSLALGALSAYLLLLGVVAGRDRVRG